MSIFRVEEIRRRFIRFDDKRTRSTHLEPDKLAIVSYVWDLAIQQRKTCVIQDTDVTIDEKFVEFRGRYRFVQYMPSKPTKYGMKIFWMYESKSGYVLGGLVYVNRQPGEPPHKNLGLEVVQAFHEPNGVDIYVQEAK
ncbi:hypothetical protein Trydic_g11694 [Trypoxylus dichotomus]